MLRNWRTRNLMMYSKLILTLIIRGPENFHKISIILPNTASWIFTGGHTKYIKTKSLMENKKHRHAPMRLTSRCRMPLWKMMKLVVHPPTSLSTAETPAQWRQKLRGVARVWEASKKFIHRDPYSLKRPLSEQTWKQWGSSKRIFRYRISVHLKRILCLSWATLSRGRDRLRTHPRISAVEDRKVTVDGT